MHISTESPCGCTHLYPILLWVLLSLWLIGEEGRHTRSIQVGFISQENPLCSGGSQKVLNFPCPGPPLIKPFTLSADKMVENTGWVKNTKTLIKCPWYTLKRISKCLWLQCVLGKVSGCGRSVRDRPWSGQRAETRKSLTAQEPHTLLLWPFVLCCSMSVRVPGSESPICTQPDKLLVFLTLTWGSQETNRTP